MNVLYQLSYHISPVKGRAWAGFEPATSFCQMSAFCSLELRRFTAIAGIAKHPGFRPFKSPADIDQVKQAGLSSQLCFPFLIVPHGLNAMCGVYPAHHVFYF